MATRIQIRRDTEANWNSVDPVLAQGELGLNLDTNQIKIGDGLTAWNSLSYTNLALDINDLDGVTITDAQNGDFLRYSSSASAWINDPVNLSTDTVGDYVQSLVAGTGVSLENNSGEGATPTIAIGQAVETSSSVTFVHVSADVTGDLVGNVTGDVTGNADTATTLETTRTISLSGDVSGSVSFNGSQDVVISATVQPDSVALGVDTTGNYMSDLTQGTGVSITHTPGEGSNATIAIGQAVGTSSSVQFASVTAPLTGNASTATALETARTISLTGDLSGSVSFNGTSDVSISATVQPNSVALGTDTTGNYINDLTQGTGVTVTHTPGEGSSPTVAIGQDVATSASVTFAHVSAPVTGSVTGNASTATTLQTGRTISLSGDVSGSVSFDGSADATISAIIQPNSVALGTDTTGNYVNDVAAGTGVTVTHTPAEGSSPTIAIGQDVATSASVTFARLETTGNVVIGGNLTVNGDTTTLNTETLSVEDNTIVLNSNATGSPTLNAGIEVERGDSANVSVRWNESTDSWELTEDGSTYKNIAVGQDVETSASVQFVAVTAELVGNSSTSSALKTPRTISLSGDVSGSVSFDGSANVDITATVQPNSVALGTDTTGNYVNDVTAGTGVTVTHTPGEGTSPTIAIGQAVGTSASVTFANVTADLVGDVTGNASTASALETSRTFSLTGDISGSVSFDGSADATISATIQPNSVALGADTTGNFLADIVAGTAISITHTPGEASSASVALNASLDDLNDVLVNTPEKYQILVHDGAGWENEYPTVVSNANNAEATTLTIGTAVYLFGGTGTHASVKRADNSSDETSSKTVGLVAESIGSGLAGAVITRGYLKGIDLSSGYSNGDILWLGKNGQFTTTKTQAPDHLVFIGVVVSATNNGVIYVATQNGYELNELHDVKTNGKTNKDVLMWNSASAVWTNEQINLGTDTVGDYVQSLVAGTGLTITNNSGESTTPTLAIGQDVATSSSVVFAQVETTGSMIIGQNLYVSGSIVTENEVSLSLEDPFIYLNANNTITNPDLGIAGNYNDGIYHHAGVFRDATDGKWKFFDSYEPEPSHPIDTGHASYSAAPVVAEYFESTITTGTAPLVVSSTTEVANLHADTATTLHSARGISLGGDLSGSVSFDGSTDVTITATIQPNSVELGTDTTGNYMSGVAEGTGVTIIHTPGEGSSATISIGQPVATSSSVTFASVTAPVIGNASTASALETTRTISLTGDVSGSVSFNGSADASISATIQPNSVALGTDTTGNYVNDLTAGTGVTVTHTPGEGSSPTVAIGQAVGTSSSVQFAAVTAPLIGNVTGNLTGDVTGNADTATSLETARTISLGGDLSGSASFDGTSNVTITATVQPDSVSLGTDTTGNFMSDVVGGTGVTISHTPGESSSASVSIGQDVATSASVTFAAVNAPVVGNVTGDLTGNADTATALETARTISLTGDVSGSVSFDGTGDVSITATVQPDSVALGTDTTGNYVNDLTGGTGVTITHTPGEGSNPTVAIGQSVATSASVTFAHVAADVTGNVTGNITGSSGSTTGNAATATALQNARTISLSGDVSGSVSFDGTSNVSISATVQPDSVALGTDTTGNYVNDLTAGTGVTITHTPAEGSSPTVAIGQSVATSASVTFAQVDTTGDVVVGGNLTVNGTTTTLNTETLAIEDNIVVLNSNVTGSPTTNAGIEVERGTSANVALRWNETSDKWELTEDGATYNEIATADEVSAITISILDDIGDVSASTAAAGDFLKYDGAQWVNDPINLGTDTVGNYVNDVTAGTGVTVTHTPGEGSSPTIAIGQAVGTSSSVQFAAVTAPLIGNVTGNADTATTLATSRTIELTGDVTGSVSFNGSANASITATIAENSVALGTDTTGNYVADVVSGTGITISHTPGEGSSASVALNAALDDLSDVSASAPADGEFLKYVSASSAWVPAAIPTINALDDIGDVNAPSPTTGYFLKWDGAEWVPAAAGGAVTTTTISANTETTVATFSKTEAESAEFIVKVKQGERRFSDKVLVLHNGTTADFTDFGELSLAATETVAGSGAVTWVTRTSNFGAYDYINSVAYGNSLWVAAGAYGQLRTSTDAVSWTTRTSNFTDSINSVAYGNNLWVAAGNNAELRTSTDGTTWTTQTSNFGTSTILSVAYGNNLWVAAGYAGQLRTSTDAITWTTRTSNFGQYDSINSVAYGNNLWVIGGTYGQPRTSTDGITWVTRTSNFGYAIYSVAYGDNLWVIGGTLGALDTSTDGTTWTSQTSNFDTIRILSLAYGNNLWVASGRDGQIRSSTDAVTWVTRTSNFGAYDYINSVAYGNSLWVAGGDYGQISTSATDTGTFHVGGGSVSASVSFATDISGSDVRLRMTIPDAGSTSAIVKVLTTTVGES